MSVLNGGAYLRQAVDSVFAQSESDFEFIVIDNASTDNTAAILDSYSDKRMVCLKNVEVLTLTQSLNKGLSTAVGTYIARLDADDVALPTRLARQAEFLDSHPDVLVVSSHARIIDDQGSVVGSYEPPTDPAMLYDALAYSNPFVHSACMYRRDATLQAGGYPLEYVFAQDYALWLAFARQGKVAMLGEPLVDLRKHAGQSTYLPIYRFTRYEETIDLLRIAQHLPGLSSSARRRGRRSLARERLRLARELLRAGRLPSATREVVAGVLTASGCLL